MGFFLGLSIAGIGESVCDNFLLRLPSALSSLAAMAILLSCTAVQQCVYRISKLRLVSWQDSTFRRDTNSCAEFRRRDVTPKSTSLAHLGDFSTRIAYYSIMSSLGHSGDYIYWLWVSTLTRLGIEYYSQPSIGW